MYSPHLAASPRHPAVAAFGPAPDAVSLAELFAAQPVEKFAAGEAVFWEGDAAAHLFEIAEGCLRLYRILPDGRRAIMGFRFAGELLGLPFEASCRYTAEAITPVRLRRLGRARLPLDGAGPLRGLLLARLYEEMSAAQQHIIVLGQLGAEERVASFLVSAARRTGAERSRPVVIELPMTRLDIADYLGLTLETVCRMLSKLKQDGLIALEGRHRVVLRRLSALVALSGEAEDEPAASLQPAVWPH